MSRRQMQDYERIGMIDSLQCGRDEQTDYVPPPRGTKWRIFRAIGMLPIDSNDKAVLSVIVDHANPITGRADPGQLRIARLLGLHIRTVKRAIGRLRKTPYLSRRLRGLSSTAYQVNWRAILHRDKAYEDSKRCQSCHLDGDKAVPSVVSELSPKNEKRKRKEKTKHEMAPSREGALSDDFLNEEERGFQKGAKGEPATNVNSSAERKGSYGLSIGEVARKFWADRKADALNALKSESDPRRREELESAVARAAAHLKGTAQ